MDKPVVIRSDVPCNGCTACCKRDLLFLHPELGDKPETYEYEHVYNPVYKREGLALKHKPNGDCVYLGPDGCTIHERAPAICREFDCRRFYLRLSRPERRRGVREGYLSKEVLDAAKARLDTLPERQKEKK